MMETAFLDPVQSRRRPTDLTIATSALPEPQFGTPLYSRTVVTSLDPASFSLAGGDILARLHQPDLVSRVLEWWTLGDLKDQAADLAEPHVRSETTTALDAVRQLMELFEVSMETLAIASGVGRTTILHWQREGSSPRPSTVDRLWRLYGVGMGLNSVLGVAGTRSWLRSGSPAPLAMLSQGSLSRFERLASTVLFGARAARAFEPGITVADDDTDIGIGAPMRPARGVRRRRRQSRRA